MGKETHLNPILSGPKKSSSIQPAQPRKINKNKKHDIKIPVSENLEMILRREAVKNWGGSKTLISTEIFMYGLDHLHIYPEVHYSDGPITVHIKIEHDVYEKLGQYAAEWRCSMRQAAHRIFIETIKKKQLGGVVNDKV